MYTARLPHPNVKGGFIVADDQGRWFVLDSSGQVLFGPTTYMVTAKKWSPVGEEAQSKITAPSRPAVDKPMAHEPETLTAEAIATQVVSFPKDVCEKWRERVRNNEMFVHVVEYGFDFNTVNLFMVYLCLIANLVEFDKVNSRVHPDARIPEETLKWLKGWATRVVGALKKDFIDYFTRDIEVWESITAVSHQIVTEKLAEMQPLALMVTRYNLKLFQILSDHVSTDPQKAIHLLSHLIYLVNRCLYKKRIAHPAFANLVKAGGKFDSVPGVWAVMEEGEWALSHLCHLPTLSLYIPHTLEPDRIASILQSSKMDTQQYYESNRPANTDRFSIQIPEISGKWSNFQHVSGKKIYESGIVPLYAVRFTPRNYWVQSTGAVHVATWSSPVDSKAKTAETSAFLVDSIVTPSVNYETVGVLRLEDLLGIGEGNSPRNYSSPPSFDVECDPGTIWLTAGRVGIVRCIVLQLDDQFIAGTKRLETGLPIPVCWRNYNRAGEIGFQALVHCRKDGDDITARIPYERFINLNAIVRKML